MKFIVQFW